MSIHITNWNNSILDILVKYDLLFKINFSCSWILRLILPASGNWKIACVAHICSLHYLSVVHHCSTVKKGLQFSTGFSEPLPAYLIMYNQKNGNRHTGRLWSEIFTPSQFVSIFFFLVSLGIGRSVNSYPVMSVSI